MNLSQFLGSRKLWKNPNFSRTYSYGRVHWNHSFTIFSAKLAPVGQGRSSPNQLPYLPPPIGRIKLSLNPFKTFVRKTFYSDNASGTISRICGEKESLYDVLSLLLYCTMCHHGPYGTCKRFFEAPLLGI
jgi:hypothetical protein